MASLSSEWAKYLEPNLTEAIHEGYNEHPDSVSDIFIVNDNTSGIIRVHDSWGPAAINTSSEGATSPEVGRTKGYNFRALVKSPLINWENPFGTTHTKQGNRAGAENEHGDLVKRKRRSELYGNIESMAEMTMPC
jgi:hypothetical protein